MDTNTNNNTGRRVFSSNRLNDQRYIPYVKKKQSIFGRVKNYFFPVGQQQPPSTNTTNTTENEITTTPNNYTPNPNRTTSHRQIKNEPHFEFSGKTKLINPFDFIEPVTTTKPSQQAPLQNTPQQQPTSTNTNTTDYSILQQDSPNVTLSKFFAEKGDQPLSNIEIEGVLALMSKGLHQNDDDENNNDYTINSPPLSQSQFESKILPKPNAKRVINYSSIPSNTRTKLQKPMIHNKPSSSTPIHSTTINHSRTIPTAAMAAAQSPHITNNNSSYQQESKSNKAMSNTAKAFLSILDQTEGTPNNTGTIANTKLGIKDIANPYADTSSSSFILSSSRKRRQQQQQQQQQQQRKKVGEIVANSPVPAKSVSMTESLENTPSVTSSTSSSSAAAAAAAASAALSARITETAGPAEDIEEISSDEEEEEEEEEEKDEDEDEEEEEEEEEEDEEEQEEYDDNDVVELSDDDTPESTTIPVATAATASAIASVAEEFIFPTLPTPSEPIQVDDLKVEQYKALFEF